MTPIKLAALAAVAALSLSGLALSAGGARSQELVKDGTHIQGLAGRWTGTGLVQWRNGSSEPYKCVVTYFLDDSGAHVQQNLRCSGEGGKLELATKMLVTGLNITGTWEERNTAMRGDVRGRVTPAGFEALAHNPHFAAKFEIAMTSDCEQTVIITPNRQIQVITATLKKNTDRDACR